MIEYRNVPIPSSALEWQLYIGYYSSDIAASALTRAAKRAVDLIHEAKLGEAAQVPLRALEEIEWCQLEYDRCGACDSEPYAAARLVVSRAMKVIADVDIDPSEL